MDAAIGLRLGTDRQAPHWRGCDPDWMVCNVRWRHQGLLSLLGDANYWSTPALTFSSPEAHGNGPFLCNAVHSRFLDRIRPPRQSDCSRRAPLGRERANLGY